ncbi:MAG: NADH-quinone oxidoreductase subunit J [Pseudomonadota bacterium]
MSEIIIFYIFAAVSLFAALGVLLHPNPIMSALHLVAAMVGVSGLFFNLNAPFIAAVQIMVYAGAVMVLFLFVVMIFDVKEEGKKIFSPGKYANGLKVLFGGMFAGLLLSSILFKISGFGYLIPDKSAPQFEVRNLSKVIFTEYVFTFEVLGLLLLVIPIGTVALSRIRGGTHAE